MPHAPTTFTLATADWTLLAEYTGSDQPRMVRIANESGGADLEVLVSTLHIENETTPSSEVGVDVAQGDYVELGAVRPSNGNVFKVWGKGNGASGKVSAVL